MRIGARIIEIIKRFTGFDKSLGIIINGSDNNYPERIDRYIDNSGTARTSSKIMATYIAGRGFGKDDNTFKVNQDQTLLKLSRTFSRSSSRQGGIFIHVNYDMNFEFTSIKVLPYSHCRKGKKDDTNYNGKIIVYDNWDHESRETGKSDQIDEDRFHIFDVFNPIEKVILAQVEAEKGEDLTEKFKAYKGQVLYINSEEEMDYALAPINAVQLDADSESQASIYKNRMLRNGFTGKQFIVTKPLVGRSESFATPALFNEAKNERENFKRTVDKFYGAKNSGNGLHIELEAEGQSLDDVIKIINVPSEIDDKLFKFTESSVFRNILTAFNQIPEGLYRQENSLFGQGGESLKVMAELYQNNTMFERDEMEQTLNMLMLNFKDFKKEIKLIPLIDIEVKPIEVTKDGTTD